MTAADVVATVDGIIDASRPAIVDSEFSFWWLAGIRERWAQFKGHYKEQEGIR